MTYPVRWVILRVMSEQELIRKAMKALGSRTSEAKAAASRRNGSKGGRPVTRKESK